MTKKDYEWFKNAKYGLMIHFGLYSMLEGVYKGKRSGNYSEWIQSKYQIPIHEMEKLAKNFNPTDFDAEKIVKFAISIGAKYLVFTTKHHEGFCLFDSKVDDYNSFKMSICHRDFVKEISDACHKFNLKLGFYYSQDLDWHEKHGGGYLSHFKEEHPDWIDGTTFDNSWDFNRKGKNFSIYFENKVKPQIKELLTNYGEVATFWFDVPITITYKQSKELRNLVKSLQPKCLIDSRIGNGLYDYISLEDNEIPNDIKHSRTVKMNENLKPNKYGLYEAVCSLNKSFGYCSFDNDWKTPNEIKRMKSKLNNLGINLLINVGPDRLGRIPKKCIEILQDAMKK